jgi:membrane-bound lytic murein transglycosylase D
MKFTWVKFCVAPFVALAMGTACQSGKKPVTAIPAPHAQAPSLAPTTTPLAQPAVQPEASVTPATEAPKTESVEDLLAKVDQEFQTGQANFKAGKVDAAKENFNHCTELLKASSINLDSDTRLQRKLNEISEALKSVDQQEQQQTEAATEQQAEPAPIDEANEAAPPVDPSVKARAEVEIKFTRSDLPLMMTDEVAAYINYFSGRGRGILERGLVRSGRYDEMIRSTLKEQGVPQDLIYLAQAESGFHPLALSRVGARGMWQFMASRGAGYGLQRTKWIDERQDPEKATRAAARHLKDLYNQFGDWYLAMAAYNSGPGTVQSAVKRTGYADFWELYKRNVIPKETRNYVPIILAVTIMAKNPTQYGLNDLVPDKPLAYDSVKIDYPVDLRLVAQTVDATPSDIQDLNPSLLRWTTPEQTEFELRLPAGSKDKYEQAIASIPQEMRVWWRYHKVQPGDSVASIAQSYRSTPQAILRANELSADSELAADTRLVIPIAPGRHATSEDAQAYSRRFTRYTVHHGDTADTVADRFGVPVAMVRRWNGLRSNSLRGRRTVFVHLPVTPGSSPSWAAQSTNKSKSRKTTIVSEKITQPKPVVHHKVKEGETLTSISTAYHTSVAALKRDNGDLAILRPGMVLLIRAR